MQTILGANGTIGSLLAKELKAYTNEIRLVSRNPKQINGTDELYPADLSDSKQIDKAIAGSAVVYLLVGLEYNTKVWQAKWPPLMRATIDACIKHKAKLVFFDNVYMYDVKEIPNMTETSQINPISKKGEVRKEIAEMLLSEVKAGRLTGLIARSADFYGPNNNSSMLVEMVYKNLKKGKSPMWPIDINKKHSFTYTPDAAKATAILGNTDDAYNQVWHVPTDNDTKTIRELIVIFCAEMGVNKKASVMPMWMLKLIGLFIPVLKEMPEMMYQCDRDYIFDSSKFEKRFGIKATTYLQGIRSIVN